MREDTVQLQRAVDDVLASLNLRPLASYCSTTTSPPMSRNSSQPPDEKRQVPVRGISLPTVRFQDQQSSRATSLKMEDEPAHRGGATAMAREHSQNMEEQDGQLLFSNPMGSLYEVTRLRGLRGSIGSRFGHSHPSEDMDADFISRGLISSAEAQELFALYLVPSHTLVGGRLY